MQTRVVILGVAALVASMGSGCAASPAPRIAESEIPTPHEASPRVFVAEDAKGDPRVSGLVTGLEELHVGMSTGQIVDRVGKPERTASHEEEAADWAEAGYATNRSVIFANGFDQVLVFEPKTVPLFKAYSAHGKVRALKFVYYGSEASLEERPVGFGACVLGADANTVEQVFGIPEAKHHEDGMSALDKLHYFARGISITVEEGKVVVFDIYTPPTEATKRELIDLIYSERRTL